ncbi:hypothetical protein EYZ11_003982 [Aspergillus tanneri]|uniref:Uncharacterized protein n=1 Tax=Aspergillus tanneri TaxID=1220188 RepID=A0A4S3JP20_9EURO|nr:hypothetical protein EYZ11_003982 [Aspergillus tanneri]
MSKVDEEHSSATSETNDTFPPPTFFQRWKTHMKKWWWLYLIVFCIVVLITVLPMCACIRLLQTYINDYEFDYSGLTITDLTPNSLHISQSQKLHIGGSFRGSGHLDPFNASLSIPGSDTSFATLPIPQISFSDSAVLNLDQVLNLSCVSCFSELATKAISNKEFGILLTGKPDLKVNALPTAHLDFHKTMTMQGYDAQEFLNLNGAFNITDLRIISPREQGYNINATIAFRNPTRFTVEMGTVSFNLSMGNTPLGYIDIPNLTLQQNHTNADVLGNINMSSIINQGIWASSNSDFGNVTIDLHGNRCVYNGQEIPYFTAAFRALNASIQIDLLKYAKYIL